MKVCVITFGCTMNQGDSEALKAIIAEKHEIVEELRLADAVVVNSCGVIERTERNVLAKISKLKKEGKKVIVAGCLPRINPEALEKTHADAILSGKAQNGIADVIEALKDNKSQKSRKVVKIEEFPFDRSKKIRKKDSAIAIVNIAEGCLGNCSYCATKFARGKLKSRSIEDILREVKECLALGYKEIQLTSQDNGVYGIDIGYRLPELLGEICRINKKFRVRIGMMNPTFVKDILEELIEAYDNKKIYKFLHLPVQSGDNEVLEHMNRGYTADDFREIVKAFRKKFPDFTLSTDIIVGYPTESEESFEKTYKLVEEVKPEILNITRFSPRPRTKASELKDMPDRYKKERSRRLTALIKKIGEEKNKKLIGKEYEVLIVKHGKKNTPLSRTNFYRQVVLNKGRIGEFKRVKIKGATFSYLIGEG